MDTTWNSTTIPKEYIASWILGRPGIDVSDKLNKIIEKAYVDHHVNIAREAYHYAHNVVKTYTEKKEYLELAIAAYKAVGYYRLVIIVSKDLDYLKKYHLRDSSI